MERLISICFLLRCAQEYWSTPYGCEYYACGQGVCSMLFDHTQKSSFSDQGFGLATY